MTRKTTEAAPPQVPYIPGRLCHRLETDGLARDLVAGLTGKLTDIYGCLIVATGEETLCFAPAESGREFAAFLDRQTAALRAEMAQYELITEEFPRAINERAQACVKAVLANLSTAPIGTCSAPKILDLEVGATGWQAWIRTGDTGVMAGATYMRFIDRVRADIKAGIRSSYVNPFQD